MGELYYVVRTFREEIMVEIKGGGRDVYVERSASSIRLLELFRGDESKR